jgi:arylsulfatase A-like enzyme
MFGKWGLGHEGTGGLPELQGFDEFYGYLDQVHAHNSFPSFLIRGSKREALTNVVSNETSEGGGVATERNEYAHERIFSEAIGFLDRHHAEPFFLYLPVTIPHANNEAGKDGMEIPDVGRFSREDWPQSQKALAAMITRLDSDVGTLLDRLEIHGITGNTFVFFSSDNGPHREGGANPDFFDSNGRFRGIKRDLYEGGIRVPLLVRCPGRIAAGSVSSHWCYNGDLFATFCDLAGTRVFRGLDSVSIAPTLLGRADEQGLHPYLYWEFHERGFSQAVRHGEWKAVRSGGEGGKVELYNLIDDPGETTDLADKEPRVVRQMAGFMKEGHQDSPQWPVKKAGGSKPAS